MQRTLRLSAAPHEVLLLAALAATLIPTMYGTHPGEGVLHWLAAAIAAVAGLSLVVAATRERAVDLFAAALALCSAAAATVHFAVISEHVDQYWLFGVFFAFAGLAQALWAVLVVERGSARVYAAGAAGNAAIVTMWVVSRTIGLPLGPNPGEAEAVGTADVMATALELLVVAGSLVLLLGRRRLGPGRRLLLPLMVCAALLTTLALVSVTGEAHSHDEPAGHVNHHD